MFTEKEIDFLNEVSKRNSLMDELIDEMNNLNIEAMTIIAKKDPENLTPEMIIELARHSIDVRDLNDYFKSILPECFELVHKTDKAVKPKAENKINRRKVNIRKVNERSQGQDMEDNISESQMDQVTNRRQSDMKIKDIPYIQTSASAVPPTGKVTGNVVHDDLKKRGVIFVRCNKSPDIEERVVDELIQAANDRDIMIQEFILNEQDGVNKLKAWMESGVIDYIIMNDLGEYSQAKIAQFFFVDDAYRRGIKILLKANDYNPIFPF